MFRTLAILCLVAPAFGIWEKGLKVRFDINPLKMGSTSFIPLPQTQSEAVEAGWVMMTGPALPAGYECLVTLCPSQDDLTLCELFDDTGMVAGLQIAFNPSNFIGAVFDWTVSGFCDWNVTVDGVTTTYYVIRQYLVSPEFLAMDAATRVYDYDYIVQGGDLYVTGFHGEIYNVSTNVEYLKTGGDYTKEACIPGMGNHYYYNMTTTLECRADRVLCWFPLEYNDQLVGVGFTLPGDYIIESGKLNPFEKSTKAIIETTIPTAPDCLYEYGTTPGVLTMHTYFIEDPYLMTCIW